MTEPNVSTNSDTATYSFSIKGQEISEVIFLSLNFPPFCPNLKNKSNENSNVRLFRLGQISGKQFRWILLQKIKAKKDCFWDFLTFILFAFICNKIP